MKIESVKFEASIYVGLGIGYDHPERCLILLLPFCVLEIFFERKTKTHLE